MSRRTGPNYVRRQAIKRAMRRVKDGDLLKLEDLAMIWGVVKTRFVNVKGDIDSQIGFPVPVPSGNTHLYPAREALTAMYNYETRDDQLDKDRSKKIDRILGRGEKGKGKASQVFTLPIGEMAQLSRIAAEIEEREREQGLYVPASDVASAAADVFGMFSEYLDDLDNRVDPNGILPAEIRQLLASQGTELLLKLHSEMRDMLGGNARTRSSQRPGLRRAAGRAR